MKESVYYRLRRDMVLRGWEDMPRAVIHRPDNSIYFLKEDEFKALELCSGLADCDGGTVSGRVKDLIGRMAEYGIVERCAYGDGLEPDQYYRRYPNRFVYAVDWPITGKCSHCCGQCHLPACRAQSDELSHEQVMDIIGRMEERGILSVSVTGDGALVRDDWWDIVDALVQRKIDIGAIHTSGELVSEALLDGLKARGLRPEFIINYDDSVRALEVFSLCRQKRFRATAEMALHRGNAGALRQCVNTLAAHGCAGLKVGNAADTKLWAKNGGDCVMPLEETYAVYEKYIPEYFMDGSPLRLNLGGAFLCGRESRDFVIPIEEDNSADARLCQSAHFCWFALETDGTGPADPDPSAELLLEDGWAKRIRAAAATV